MPTKPKRKSVITFVASFIILAGALSYFIPVYNEVTCIRSRRIQKVANVRSLVTACVAYSKDWEEFPPNLQALFPTYIDDDSLLTSDIDGKPLFLYRSGFSDTDYSREPLIMGPMDEDGNRLIGYIGGHVTEHGSLPPEILAEFE